MCIRDSLYTNNYKSFGSLILSQAGPTSGTYGVQGGKAQFIIGYMIAMNKSCALTSSSINKASRTATIKATTLDRKTRNGNAIEYHFKVNNGDGADILGINVGISTGSKLLIKYRCEAAIYVEYGDDK